MMNNIFEAEVNGSCITSEHLNHQVKVSVILLVFNHEEYLERALDNILNQDVNFRYEVVIGDDVSSDNSVSIIMDYAERYPEIIVPVIRKSNVGASKNFADLFRRCIGKYITFTEGDDFWSDNKKLQIQYDYLEKNPRVFSVSHQVNMCDSNGNSIGIVPNTKMINGRITMKDVLSGKRFAFTATMMREIHGQKLNKLLNLVESGPRNACDLTVALFLLDECSIPILDKVMSVYCYRSIEGDTNYNSITKISNKVCDRLIMLGINDRFYSGEYYFGLMYIRLMVSAARGFIRSKPLELIDLVFLILKIFILFVRSSLLYAFGVVMMISRNVQINK